MDWIGMMMSIITFLMVLVLVWQVWELRRATGAQVFCSILDRLQDEGVRKAREIILEMGRKGVSIDLSHIRRGRDNGQFANVSEEAAD